VWLWEKNDGYWTQVKDGAIPSGVRLRFDFFTAERELVSLYGSGAGGQDPPVHKHPNYTTGKGLGHVAEKDIVIPANHVNGGIEFLGDNPNPKLQRNSAGRYTSQNTSDPAIF